MCVRPVGSLSSALYSDHRTKAYLLDLLKGGFAREDDQILHVSLVDSVFGRHTSSMAPEVRSFHPVGQLGILRSGEQAHTSASGRLGTRAR